MLYIVFLAWHGVVYNDPGMITKAYMKFIIGVARNSITLIDSKDCPLHDFKSLQLARRKCFTNALLIGCCAKWLLQCRA